MLFRLNDSEISSRWCRQASGFASNQYEACCLICVGLTGLACKSGVLEERGFELSEAWKSDLDCAYRHFDEHLASSLNETELESLHEFCLAATLAAIKDPENLFAYASGGGR